MTPVKPEPMDCFTAVFNVHTVDKRCAARSFIRKWGRDAYQREILQRIEGGTDPSNGAPRGVMSIFHEPPTRHTLSWVYTVRYFVNRRLRHASK